MKILLVFCWICAYIVPSVMGICLMDAHYRGSFDAAISKNSMNFASLVDRMTSVILKSQVSIYSRVQLGNLPPKPEEDKTPDLLYALRLYLTGDDGANAIQITGVSDGDNE